MAVYSQQELMHNVVAAEYPQRTLTATPNFQSHSGDSVVLYNTWLAGLKEALDNFNIIPTFFSKQIEISISSEAYPYKMTTC